MSIRFLFIFAAILVALSAAWGKRQSLQALLAPPPPPPSPIQFDNGTVREYLSASDASPSTAQSQLPPGAMRKCFKGQQITYSNMACPPGYKEKTVGGPPVNVLPAQSIAQSKDPQAPGKARSSVHEVLDLSRDDHLKERMMERAIGGQK